MEVYFLLIFSCVIFSLIYDYINQRLVKNILALVLFIVLVSVPALRNVTVGSDSRMYAEFLTYNYSILEWVNQGIEIGDGAIYWLISNLFGQQYFYLFLFYALIINFLFLYTIIKLEKNYNCNSNFTAIWRHVFCSVEQFKTNNGCRLVYVSHSISNRRKIHKNIYYLSGCNIVSL